MLYLLPLVGLLQTCAGEGVYSLPTSPIVSTSEAHGPLARLALSSARAQQPLQYYTASGLVPVPQTPVVVPHPPAVATHAEYAVPLARYLPQPGFVQKIVDVPTTKVATAKLQVRRPAIQKQFYDIEQRTVIRPVGSAVVELEEPLSKNLVAPFSVSPSSQHTVARYPQQLVYPVSAYPFGPYAPFQGAVQYYPPSFIQQPQLVGQRPVVGPQPPQQVPSYPRPPQQIPQFPQPPQPRPPTTPPVSAQPPQQFPLNPQPSKPDDSSENNDFDSSDTVVIDNPDFERSAGQPRKLTLSEKETRSSTENEGNDIQEKPNEQQEVDKQDQLDRDQQKITQQILNEFQSRQIVRALMRQPVLQPLQRFQQIIPLQMFKPFEQPIVRLDEASSLLRSQGLSSIEPIDLESESTNSTQSTSTTEISETNSTIDTGSLNLLRSSNEPQVDAQRLQTRQYYREGQIPSVRNLSPEEAQDNQQKLIELLTGQGQVSEIDLSKSEVRLTPIGDSGVVRGRVLSVTPASLTDQMGDERISTRRVVVSRPIQTLEEVDVHQPFTNVERVAVHEPALINTAHPQIAAVSTAVPVLAPTPTPLVYH